MNYILLVLLETRTKKIFSPDIYIERLHTRAILHGWLSYIQHRVKDHTPIRTRAGNGNGRGKKHVQRCQKHECAVQYFCLEYASSILIEEKERERITSQTKTICMNELSSLEISQMTMTGTYEGYHAFTAPT